MKDMRFEEAVERCRSEMLREVMAMPEFEDMD